MAIPAIMEKRRRKPQQLFMSLRRNSQLFQGVQRGQWWSQRPYWGRGVGTGQRLSCRLCPHCQSHEGWQVWFLGSHRAAQGLLHVVVTAEMALAPQGHQTLWFSCHTSALGYPNSDSVEQPVLGTGGQQRGIQVPSTGSG